ncbi:transcription factor/nuclear export subunit protein 2-domain-containing protein [Auriculariales sp. MPI-PUGE-AT-0066]|nr:transcription factor/nuclear export subunit protein 2-domain-containing protein [Auriculariales sp. MPI-PUGE-AT-0066]
MSADVAGHVRTWNEGGEQRLFDALLPLVAQAVDPASTSILYESCTTIFTHAVPCFAAPNIPPARIAALLQRLLQSLPSSSSGSRDNDPNAVALRDTIIDVIWSLDTSIDDRIAEVAAHIMTLELATATASRQPNRPVDQADPNAERDDPKVLQATKATLEQERSQLASLLRELLTHSVLLPTQCRMRLDFGLLAAAGLVTNKVPLEKKEIQTRTRLFYKQNKFNLLREQSEGYSKLATELLASIPPAHGLDSQPFDSPAEVARHARTAWDKVATLIGYFDLDPNRALDVILDAFCSNVASHYQFFIAMLRLSPWCNPLAQPEGESMTVDPQASPGSSIYTGQSLENVLRIAQGLPPINDDVMDVDDPSSAKVSVCSQVLGFKFAYYANVAKLSPVKDDEMKDARAKFDKELLDKISNARSSALALAAPLTDDSSSKSTKTGEQQRQESKAESAQQNQRIQFVHALLAVGALVPSFELLSQTPWVVSAYPELADLLLRVAHHSLQPLYEQSLNRHPRFAAAASGTRSRFAPSTGLAAAAPRKQVLSAWAPVPPSTATTEFVYFYPAWKDWLPLCTVASDVSDVLEPILRFIGPLIYRDTEFMTKVCRVGKIQLTSKSQTMLDFWFLMARLYLLPGMSLMHNNIAVAVEVWGVIGVMDSTKRWSLYGEWGNRSYQLYPELRVRKVEADREARAIMRRLGSKNVQTLARAVGKLAHSNPCILFANMVGQVQAYDNLADVVIESLKYCTILPSDVLLYTVLQAFADPDKERVKEDGISVSQWLQSLASFTGSLCRRYPQIEQLHVLQYIVNRLREDQINDIILLRELIAKSTGINPVEDLSSDAIVALTGGTTLRIEATASSSRGILVDKATIQTKATERLVAALQQHDSQLGRALLVLTARQSRSCVFLQKEVRYLKSLSTLYDAVQQVQTQLIECLSTTMSPPAFARLLPPFQEMCARFGVDVYMAMQIYRPKILHDIFIHIDAYRSVDAKPTESAEEAERRLKAALAAKRGEISAVSTPDSKANPATESGQAAVSSASPWLPPLEGLISDVASVLEPSVVSVLGAPFFVTFWQLSLLDLRPPMDHYKAQTDRLSKDLKAKNEELKNSSRNRDVRQKRDKIQSTLDALVKETAAVMHNLEFTRGRLNKEKAHWFAHNPATQNSHVLVAQILQHCIMPRALLSPMDADYCAFFIKTLHLIATPGFHTLRLVDRLFGDSTMTMVFSCTASEARNYGRFLKNILADLMSWHKNQDGSVDKRTGSYLPGFSLKVNNAKKLASTDVMDLQGFRRFLRKCHARVSGGLTACIGGGEYMSVYNSIVILNELSDVMPLAEISQGSGDIIFKTVKDCVDKENREDLKILAQAQVHFLSSSQSFELGTQVLGQVESAAKLWGSQPSAAQAAKGAVDTKNRPTTPSTSGAPSSIPARPMTTSQGTSTPTGPALSRTPDPGASRSAAGSDANRALSSIPRPDVVKRVSREPTKPDPASANSRSSAAASANGTANSTQRSVATQQSALPSKPEPVGRSEENRLTHRDLTDKTNTLAASQTPPCFLQARQVQLPRHRIYAGHQDEMNGTGQRLLACQQPILVEARLRRAASRPALDGPTVQVVGVITTWAADSQFTCEMDMSPAILAIDNLSLAAEMMTVEAMNAIEIDRRPGGPRAEDEVEQAGSKRRRQPEDEAADRSSKRSGGSSRHKDSSSHRDDRSRHRSDKERDRRDSNDKRGHRKDREGREDSGREREPRGGDDRTPRSEPITSSKPNTAPPSQPRAMVGSERSGRAEGSSRGPDGSRPAADITRTPQSGAGSSGPVSLRDRIGAVSSPDSAASREGSLKRSYPDTSGDGRDSEGDNGRKRQRIVRGRYKEAITSSQLGGPAE